MLWIRILPIKGTVTWDGFLAKSDPSCIEREDMEKFLFSPIISRAMLIFVALEVLGEYAKSFFPYSLCTHKFFLHILRICQNSLGIYGEDEIGKKEGTFQRILLLRSFSIYAKILYVHSPCAPKFFMPILHIRQNLFCKYVDNFW
jgi:hypothetical protein